MTDSSNSTEDRIVIEASLCGGKPVVVGFEGYSLEHIAEMIEAATGCSLLGPHDPRLLREHRARRVAEIRAALRLDTTPTKPRRQHKPRNPPPDGLMTAERAAAKLGCSTKTLDGYVKTSALPYVALGHGKKRSRKMFRDADLDDFIANQTRKDSPTCRSDATRARRSTHTTFKSEVVAFTARPNARTSGKRKR